MAADCCRVGDKLFFSAFATAAAAAAPASGMLVLSRPGVPEKESREDVEGVVCLEAVRECST
jgi:hypothetical protein